MATGKGISIHLGLNSVDPGHYAGWSGQLNACENDAHSMEKIARARGFTPTVLLTHNATAERFRTTMQSAAKALTAGDILFLTYSGHGGQVPDTNADETEDGQDETWCLYNRELVDDELYAMFGALETGVRVLMISDSCHSGTVARFAAYSGLARDSIVGPPPGGGPPAIRGMDEQTAAKVYQANSALYKAIQSEHKQGERVAVGASIILLSGCQDNQFSYDGPENGLFTSKLLQVWSNGSFKGGYRKFHREILRRMPLSQSPNYFLAGTPSRSFTRQTPFAV